MSQRAAGMQEVWSASAYCCSLITEPNCLIRSETTRKPQCYTAPGQRLFLSSGWCIFLNLGTGGRAQPCSSPIAWLLVASLLCKRTKCLVWALPRAWQTWGQKGEGQAEAQTFCLLTTSGISVVYVGNMGGLWQSQCGYCIWADPAETLLFWKLWDVRFSEELRRWAPD